MPSVSGEKSSIDFSLPKGEYIVKAEISGELLNNDLPRIIRYKVDIPKQNLTITQDAKIDFGYKIREIHLQSFEITGKMGKGTFSVEMGTPSESVAIGKVFIIKKVLFRTVE